jgi:hypothetical protein
VSLTLMLMYSWSGLPPLPLQPLYQNPARLVNFDFGRAGFFLRKYARENSKSSPRNLEELFNLPNMHGNTLLLSALLCLKIYLVPAQALAAGWIWDSVPAPLELQFKALLFFLLIFHHRRKFFYGFRNSFLFLRTPLRNPKKTLDPRSLPYFRHFFPIHVG